MIKHLMLAGLGALLFSFPLISQMTMAKDAPMEPEIVGQVGMYLYRSRSVMGYEKFDAQGHLKARVVIQRNAGGNMTGRLRYDGEGNLVTRFVYDLDDTGRMV